MANLSQFAVKNRVFSYFIILAIFILGLISFLSHPALEDPAYTIRTVKIVTINPGMAPEKVEKLITTPIEEAAKNIPELKETSSVSSTGVSDVSLEINDNHRDLENIWKKIRNKMNDVKRQLPSNTQGPFVNDEFGDIAAATLAVQFDGFTLKEKRHIIKKIRTQLFQIPEVSKINTYGLDKEKIYLEISNARMAQFGITPLQLIQAIQQQNIITASDIIETSKLNILVATSGSFETVADIKKVVIKVPHSNTTIHLSDIVSVKRHTEDPANTEVYYNAKKSIALAIYPQKKTNLVALGKSLLQKIETIQHRLPVGVTIHRATFQPARVEKSTKDFMLNLYQAFIVVGLSIFLFLGLRDGSLLTLFIPLCILLSLTVLNFMGVELQRVSIASLILALGLLVDNGVVVAEDINVRIENGVNRLQAITDTYKTLAQPLLTSTLTTILVFLPILLSNDSTAEYTRSLAQVMSVTLFLSWLLAFFFIPVVGYPFFKQQKNIKKKGFLKYFNALANAYSKCLKPAISNPKMVILSVLILFFAVTYCFRFIPSRFFPPSFRDQYFINLSFPNQTPLSITHKTTQKITDYLNNHKKTLRINSTIAYSGFGGPRFTLQMSPFGLDSDRSFIVVTTRSAAATNQSLHAVEIALLKKFPDVNARLNTLWLGSVEDGLIEIHLYGNNIPRLYGFAEKIKSAIRNIPGTQYVRDNWGLPNLRVLVKINQEKAKRIGISSADISKSLATYYSGIRLTNFRDTDQLTPIVLRAKGADRKEFSRLHTLTVYNPKTNTSVPLAQVATLLPIFEFNTIAHRDLDRVITILAKNTKLGPTDIVNKITPILKKFAISTKADYDLGHTLADSKFQYKLAGEAKSSSDAQSGMFGYLPLCFFIILAILLYQFKSVGRALIVLSAIPLSIIGAFFALLIMRATLSFMGILGILSLLGIIINHGVVLVDNIDENIASKKFSFLDAVFESTRSRFRPIIATTVTTCLGVLPLLLFGGALWYPMASVIAMGLLVCTLINIFFIPALYILMYRNKEMKQIQTESLTP